MTTYLEGDGVFVSEATVRVGGRTLNVADIVSVERSVHTTNRTSSAVVFVVGLFLLAGGIARALGMFLDPLLLLTPLGMGACMVAIGIVGWRSQRPFHTVTIRDRGGWSICYGSRTESRVQALEKALDLARVNPTPSGW